MFRTGTNVLLPLYLSSHENPLVRNDLASLGGRPRAVCGVHDANKRISGNWKSCRGCRRPAVKEPGKTRIGAPPRRRRLARDTNQSAWLVIAWCRSRCVGSGSTVRRANDHHDRVPARRRIEDVRSRDCGSGDGADKSEIAPGCDLSRRQGTRFRKGAKLRRNRIHLSAAGILGRVFSVRWAGSRPRGRTAVSAGNGERIRDCAGSAAACGASAWLACSICCSSRIECRGAKNSGNLASCCSCAVISAGFGGSRDCGPRGSAAAAGSGVASAVATEIAGIVIRVDWRERGCARTGGFDAGASPNFIVQRCCTVRAGCR